MTDDLVARLRAVDHMSVEDCFLQSSLFAHAADRLEAAEARVRELEAERDKWDRRVAYDELKAREHVNRATQQRQIDALTVRAEKAERALAEAYERCAKVADELVHADPTYDDFLDGFRAGARTSATAIRQFAQVKHEAE